MFRYEKGITLIELLVVIAMIGIISAIAIPNLLSAIQRARLNSTLADLQTIMKGLEIHMIDYDHYPIRTDFTSLVDVVETNGFSKYYWGSVDDPWRMPFRYITDESGKSYMVKSFGANKEHNNTTGDLIDPESWVGASCINIAIRTDINQVIKKGCDIVFLNGALAEKFE